MKHLSYILAALLLIAATACTNLEETEFYPTEPGSLTLAVSATAVTFSSSAGQSEISVTSNSRWTISDEGSTSWLHLAYSSEPQGTANGTFTISVDNNLANEQRSTTVVVANATQAVKITVIQGTTSMNVDYGSIDTFPSAGGTAKFKVQSTAAWEVTTIADWITLRPSSGEPSDEVVEVELTVAPNPTQTERTANLIVKGPNDQGIEPVTIPVRQQAAPSSVALFSIDKQALRFDSTGGSQSVVLTTNAPWTVTNDADWLSISQTAGNGAADSATLTISTTSANQTATDRYATITFQSSDPRNASIVVGVIQTGSEALTFGIIQVGNISASSATVTCSLVVKDFVTITSKRVLYRRLGAGTGWTSVNSTATGANDVSATLTDLVADTQYEVKIAVDASSGDIESDTTTFTTPQKSETPGGDDDDDPPSGQVPGANDNPTPKKK